MKKFITFIFIMVTGLTMMSCHKMKNPVECTIVKFSYRMVESNSMVKSSSDNEIVEFINSLLPEKITVTLKSLTDGNSYTCETGKTVTLPVGEYSVQYEEKGNQYISSTPMFKIKQNITISKDISNYDLDAIYTCCGIIYDMKEVKSASIHYINDSSHSYTCSGKIFGTNENIFFYKPETRTYVLELTVYPDDPDFVSTKIVLTSTYNKENLFIETGKYYYVHPNTVTKTDNTINIKYPEWEKGII